MARSDMFFKATGQRTGVIAGESTDKTFANQIDVVDWSWGMTAPSAVGGTRTARTQLSDLKLVKRVDKASTAMMQGLNNNELLTSAVLSVRKAGGSNPAPYLVITLTNARFTSYSVESDIGETGAPVLTENWSLSFKSIQIDHTVQSEAGASLGGSSFTGEAAPE